MSRSLRAAVAVCLAAFALAVPNRMSPRLVTPALAVANGGSITAFDEPLTESFDALTASATWTDNVTIPGWYSSRAAYVAGTGSSNAGALYSFGVAGTNPASDRALGSVASGSTGTIYQAVRLTNNTGGTITSLAISYAGEQWRNGGNTTAHTLTFQYQVADPGAITGAASTSAGWTTYAPLSFTGPIAAAGAGALDGNAPANRVLESGTLAVTVNPGQEIWLRWSDPDDSGSDHGLAIDDFSVTASGTGGGTPTDTAPFVSSTAPANADVNVPVDAPVTITFSEPVEALAGAFTIECPGGTPVAFAQSASPATVYTLTPAAPLPYSTTCAVRVASAGIFDTDTIDPPDSPAADYTFSFTTSEPPPVSSNSVVVISQLYGGGGNSGATFQNDYVELFNRGTEVVDLAGWSLQYTSAAGSTWESNVQPLGGPIGPGQYLLVSLGAGSGTAPALPPANIYGQINMSATTGKLALVDNFEPLAGNCPIGDPHLVDFVGYGSNADCREGTTNAPAPSNTRALVRAGGGSIDTDRNGSDFSTATPSPRQTAPIVELGPAVLFTDPRPNGVNAPRDATIEVRFTEAVDVFDPWFDVSCTVSGRHDSATFAGDAQAHYITPNVNFVPGERCTVTVFKNQVADQDTDDAEPNTDNLPADYTWHFTVADGAAPPEPPSVHLAMGNPSGATASVDSPDNFLMEKPEFAVSYNRSLGRPNWVSWHLTDEWIGNLGRNDTFRPDPAIPPDWYRVQAFDFAGSGFDRGHMTPNADRDNAASIPINQATFLMSNMVAQAPDNNQGPWAEFENYLRTLLPGDEVYVVAGGAGAGGSGSNGGVTTTLAGGHVTVPASTWKVALVLPKDSGDDVARVTCGTRTIAVIMPNTQGIRNDPWETYLTTVDAVETLTGYDLFSNLPGPIQGCVEAGTNGDNPPLVKGTQTIAFAQPADRTYGDLPFTVAATGGASGNPVTFAASGACTAGGANGSTIAVTGAGTCTITASQAGSDLYEAAADVVRSVTIHKASPAFSSLAAPTIEVGSPTATITGVLRAGMLVPDGVVSVSAGGASAQAAIGADGSFSAALPAAGLTPAGSPYAVAVAYAGGDNFTSAAASVPLTVVDTVAPAISGFAVTPASLGPPNHKLVDVAVTFTATDAGGAPSCSIAVGSNEPSDGRGDGHTAIDWEILDVHHVRLRAERAGGGSGRLYTLTLTCSDASGNAATAAATVAVAK